MIPEDLKVDVLELATISKQCPENLQQRCFELLLSHYLDRLTTGSTPKDAGTKTGTDANGGNHDPAAESANGASTEKKAAHESGSDLSLPDLHVKAKRFLEKTGTTIEELNQVFYKEGEEIRPLYEDLKTTKVAESQIRIALLQALASGIKTGEFQFDGEEVRKECQTRKCYDGRCEEGSSQTMQKCYVFELSMGHHSGLHCGDNCSSQSYPTHHSEIPHQRHHS
jgi:hypothetical protein